MNNDHASRRCLLSPEQVVFTISSDDLNYSPRKEASFGIIGQERAIQALQMAISIPSKGYNIFASGAAGTGKRTAVNHILGAQKLKPELLRDIAYVHNMVQEDSPVALYFQPGRARAFKKKLRRFVLAIRELALGIKNRSGFKEARDKIILDTESEESQMLFDFEDRVGQEGFTLVQVEENDQEKADLAPMIDDKPSDFDELQKLVNEGSLSERHYKELREKYFQYMDELKQVLARIRDSRMRIGNELESLHVEILTPDVLEGIDQLKREFCAPDLSREDDADVQKELEAIATHLDLVGKDLIGKISVIINEDNEDSFKGEPELSAAPLPEPLTRYDVNIIIDHSATTSPPVIEEVTPDYPRLFGSIDMPSDANSGGESPYGFLYLRPGSIIRASGGYLVLRAEDLLLEEEAYIHMKRVLQNGKAEIRNPSPGPGMSSPGYIKPDPIKVRLKVVVMGREALYDALYLQDEDFQKLFKVPAEFDYVMPRNDKTMGEYMNFIHLVSTEEKLRSVTPSGAAAILEYGVRMAEFRNQLSTQFSLIADILREANYWAGVDGRKVIDREAIQRALKERAFLLNMPEEKIDEQIISGELLIRIRGREVGRVNGLAVLDRGYYSFGRPTVISAQAVPGNDGLINVEREAGLSGEIHDKGSYIVESYVHARYARDFPLSMTARIAFEQSYVEVEGDSASSSEICSLLSAIGGIELRQDIAVTGSVNQMGEIQPVGGVIEKIEGFYEVCRQQGLTGEQGVIIPIQNIESLILSDDVNQAISSGKFHIWAIRTIDEGMEILSGLPAGERDDSGAFPEGSVNARVEARLREMAEIMKESDDAADD
jgi:predicted ATP-dependent protease